MSDMRWCVVRHAEIGGIGVVAESALPIHRTRGWMRVSDWAIDPASLHAALFVDAPEVVEPEPEPEAEESTATETPAEAPAEPTRNAKIKEQVQ